MRPAISALLAAGLLAGCEPIDRFGHWPERADSVRVAALPGRYLFLRDPPYDESAIERVWASLPFDSVSLERTSCLGACPQYVLVLGRGGRAEYRGIADTPRTGTWHSYVGLRDYGRLCHLIETLRLDDRSGRYAAPWTDDATAVLRIWRRGASEPVLIQDYGEQAPTEVWALREAMDAISARAVWRPGAWRPYRR